MEAKDAITGTAVAVLLAVIGLIILVGVILVMMFTQSGIEHSPAQESAVWAPLNATLSVDMIVPPGDVEVSKNSLWSQE